MFCSVCTRPEQTSFACGCRNRGIQATTASRYRANVCRTFADIHLSPLEPNEAMAGCYGWLQLFECCSNASVTSIQETDSLQDASLNRHSQSRQIGLEDFEPWMGVLQQCLEPTERPASVDATDNSCMQDWELEDDSVSFGSPGSIEDHIHATLADAAAPTVLSKLSMEQADVVEVPLQGFASSALQRDGRVSGSQDATGPGWTALCSLQALLSVANPFAMCQVPCLCPSELGGNSCPGCIGHCAA